VRVDDRDALKAHLERGGVSSTVVYPRLSYQQRAYEGHLMACESCPQAEQAVRDVLCLPIHAMLDGREVERVIEACNAF
jgi:dTDP-4-amino-4,6-dideoxygalactose transaminase